MKPILTLFASAFVFMQAQAQITLTAASLPEAGDILKSMTAVEPSGLSVTEAGPDQFWILDAQDGAVASEREYQDAEVGVNVAEFPGADLVVIGQTGGETYYDVTANAFSAVGFMGQFGNQLPIETAIKFDPPVIERTIPLDYGDIMSNEAAILVPIPIDLLPDSLLSGLPIQPDSMRIKIAIDRTEIVDAWGTMKLLGNYIEVLRTRRFEETETRMEVYLPFVQWLDVTDLLPLDFLGKDTTFSYIYMSNTYKEPIAVYTMNSTGDEVVGLQYKDIAELVSGTSEPEVATLGIVPNPVADICTIQLPTNDANNMGVLRVMDMTGREIFRSLVSGNTTDLNVSSWPTGSYTAVLTDANRTVIASQRILVQR